MSKKNITGHLVKNKQTKRIAVVKSEDGIDYSDIPALDSSFFSRAKLRLPQPKKQITLRIDHDVIDWFKSKGGRYQTHINAVLRLYIEQR